MDRFFRGLTAGLIGGFAMSIWNFFCCVILGIAEVSILDWSGIIVYGYKPQGIAQLSLAYAAQLSWAGFLGIVLAYLLTYTTKRGYLFKGAYLGFIFSFIIYAIPVMFDISGINSVSFGTAITDLSGGMIWGLVTAYFLKFFAQSPYAITEE